MFGIQATDVKFCFYHLPPCFKLAHKRKEEKGKGKQATSRTLLEALAKAIDSTNKEEVVRLAAEFNDSFRHLVRASVDAESIRGNGKDGDKDQSPEKSKLKMPIHQQSLNDTIQEMDSGDTREFGKKPGERRREEEPMSSEDSEVRKPKKKKNKKNAPRKKHSKSSDSNSSSEYLSELSSSSDESSSDSSSKKKLRNSAMKSRSLNRQTSLISQTNGTKVSRNSGHMFR